MEFSHVLWEGRDGRRRFFFRAERSFEGPEAFDICGLSFSGQPSGCVVLGGRISEVVTRNNHTNPKGAGDISR